MRRGPRSCHHLFYLPQTLPELRPQLHLLCHILHRHEDWDNELKEFRLDLPEACLCLLQVQQPGLKGLAALPARTGLGIPVRQARLDLNDAVCNVVRHGQKRGAGKAKRMQQEQKNWPA